MDFIGLHHLVYLLGLVCTIVYLSKVTNSVSFIRDECRFPLVRTTQATFPIYYFT